MIYSKQQLGFTLIEMIGVMAIIAILASIAAPRVFEAIEDSKISKVLGQVQTLKSAAAKFYADTGQYPVINTGSDAAQYHTFMVSNNIQGWNGPYLDREPENPFRPGSHQELASTASSAYQCDSDGDGTTEGPWLAYRVDGMTRKTMEKVSNIIDGDGGTTDWNKNGLVKEYNGNNSTIMIVCLSRT